MQQTFIGPHTSDTGDIRAWTDSMNRKGKRARRRRDNRLRERRSYPIITKVSPNGKVTIRKEFLRPRAIRGRKSPEIIHLEDLSEYGQRRHADQDKRIQTIRSTYVDGGSFADYDTSEELFLFEEFDIYNRIGGFIEQVNKRDAFLEEYLGSSDLADFCERDPFTCEFCLGRFKARFPHLFQLALDAGFVDQGMLTAC